MIELLEFKVDFAYKNQAIWANCEYSLEVSVICGYNLHNFEIAKMTWQHTRRPRTQKSI